MNRVFRELYLEPRFYLGMSVCAALCFIAIVDGLFLVFGIVALGFVVAMAAAEIFILFNSEPGFEASRSTPLRFSNGDLNDVDIKLQNLYGVEVHVKLVDELPFQFQKRDAFWRFKLKPGEEQEVKYQLRPVERGEYEFGMLRAFVSTELKLVSRRHSFESSSVVKVYPSYLKLRHYAFQAFDSRLQETGIKRIRKLGHTLEFEHIKEYVIGDDTRALNWKATARTGKAMVNQYQDERAQPIYCIVDKGRLMQMPFDNMTLLDYSINTSLVMSYIAIHKGDKAGLITFANRLETVIEPGKQRGQMMRISEALYNQKTDFPEADFERLYTGLTRNVRTRSLLLLMTNFSSLEGFKRQMPYLLRIARNHVLVVIFFQNTEVQALTEKRTESVREIYYQAIAEKSMFEQSTIVSMLRQRGVHAVLTTPNELTVDVINEYIALKARGKI